MNNGRPLSVVIVDEELPFPLNTGKRIRTYNLVTRLAKRHRIEFLCHRNIHDGEFEAAKEHFGSMGIACRPISRRLPTQSVLSQGPAFYGRLALNLLSSRPYLVDKHRSRAMQAAVEELDRRGSFDLWHCEWTPYAQFFGPDRRHPLVIAAHNVESLIWQRYYEHETHPLKRWYIGKQWKKFHRFERWAFGQATRVVTVSDDDARLATNDFSTDCVDVVENGVDTVNFRSAASSRIPYRLLFVGSLDWRPNLDGLSQFLDVAFPAIREIEPRVELQIVGRKPPRWLVDRANATANVDLQADVQDVRPFYEHAGLMIVPLRVGGGSRLKILEAASMGIPVVSTDVGAEGLNLIPGKHYIAADSIASMVEPVLRAIEDNHESAEMTAAARQQVQEFYDWDALANKLEHVWRRSLKKGAA